MPVNSGTEISLDNTCKSVYALQEFFGKSSKKNQISALKELTDYKAALEFDISLIHEDSVIKNQKIERLHQIKHHISMLDNLDKTNILKDLTAGFPKYPLALQNIMEHKNSNLYAMVLRPVKDPDNMLRAKNVVFSVKRSDPSVLHTALMTAYQQTPIPLEPAITSRQRLIQAIVAAQPDPDADFLGLQKLINEKIKIILNETVNVFEDQKGHPITKESIESSFGLSGIVMTVEEYINAILYYCAPKLFDRTMESPFYTAIDIAELSIITQFFLAQINIYCVANRLASSNFADILEASDALAKTMTGQIIWAQQNQVTIEEALLIFINNHCNFFKLSRALHKDESAAIIQQFIKLYQDIKESPHFDEFMVLDTSKSGKFVTHQSSICTSFSEFLQTEGLCHFLTTRLCDDFATMKGILPHKNEHIAAKVTIDITTFNDQELAVILEKIAAPDQLALTQQHPERMAEVRQLKLIPEFLQFVAQGKHEQAKEILLNASISQRFLLATHSFTDYSYRTFNCTAYEYAYWVKDTMMCRMLDSMMDNDTKAKMHILVKNIDQNGISYEQNGVIISGSKEASLDPLKQALAAWVNEFPNWSDEKMTRLWLLVGQAQRDVPAHVAQEYCRRDRNFSPLPKFNEEHLPRELSFYHFSKEKEQTWFPLDEDESSKLGHRLAFLRGGRYRTGGMLLPDKLWGLSAVKADLEAIINLDKVRKEERIQLRHNLQASTPTPNLRMN